MKSTKLTFVVIASSIMVAIGCATQAEKKEIEREVAAETNITSQADLDQQSSQLIETAPGLTDAQRAELISLRESTRMKTEALNQESLRLRSLLVKDMLSDNYDLSKAQLLKNKIKKAEEKKLSNFLDAVSKANRILGKQDRTMDNEYLMRDFEYRYR